MKYRLIKKFPGLDDDLEIGDILEKSEDSVGGYKQNRLPNTRIFENVVENWPDFFEKVTEHSDFRFSLGDWETINNALSSMVDDVTVMGWRIDTMKIELENLKKILT